MLSQHQTTCILLFKIESIRTIIVFVTYIKLAFTLICISQRTDCHGQEIEHIQYPCAEKLPIDSNSYNRTYSRSLKAVFRTTLNVHVKSIFKLTPICINYLYLQRMVLEEICDYV